MKPLGDLFEMQDEIVSRLANHGCGALNVKAVLRAITKEPLRRDRSVVKFSVSPSAK
jgi:hypothetical protein